MSMTLVFLCLLVFAYKDGEKIGSVISYVIQESNDKKVNLVLETGTYNIILTNLADESFVAKYVAE